MDFYHNERQHMLDNSTHLICASRVLSEFSKRIYTFLLPMLFITIWSQTFLPTAVLAFATYGTLFLILPMCGPILDRANRLRCATVLIIAKSIFNATTCLFLYYLFLVGGPRRSSSVGTQCFARCVCAPSWGSSARSAGPFASSGTGWCSYRPGARSASRPSTSRCGASTSGASLMVGFVLQTPNRTSPSDPNST